MLFDLLCHDYIFFHLVKNNFDNHHMICVHLCAYELFALYMYDTIVHLNFIKSNNCSIQYWFISLHLLTKTLPKSITTMTKTSQYDCYSSQSLILFLLYY